MSQIDFNVYFPVNFFSKRINEPFHRYLLCEIFDITPELCHYGDPNKGEPDLLLDGQWIELTLASNADKTMNYVNDIRTHKLTSDEIQETSIKVISAACKKKSEKKYSVKNTSLSVLLILPVYVWVAKYYSNIPDLIPKTRLGEMLFNLKREYIDSGRFDEIIIHMPGFAYDWFSLSVKSQSMLQKTTLSDEQIKSQKYPYVYKREQNSF